MLKSSESRELNKKDKYVCACVWVWAHVYVYEYVFLYLCVYVFMYMYMSIYTYKYMSKCIGVEVHDLQKKRIEFAEKA